MLAKGGSFSRKGRTPTLRKDKRASEGLWTGSLNFVNAWRSLLRLLFLSVTAFFKSICLICSPNRCSASTDKSERSESRWTTVLRRSLKRRKKQCISDSDLRLRRKNVKIWRYNRPEVTMSIRMHLTFHPLGRKQSAWTACCRVAKGHWWCRESGNENGKKKWSNRSRRRATF